MLHSSRRLLQSAARRQSRSLVSSSPPAPSSTPPSSAPSSSGTASTLFSTPFNPSSSSSPSSSSAASASSSSNVYAPASLLGPRSAVVSFNTYHVAESLQEAGFSKGQAEVILQVVVAGMEESTLKSTAMIATRRDLLDLKSELSEKLFSSTMRFDVAQRHSKEVIEKDLMSVRSEFKAALHVEYQKLEKEMSNMEKVLTDRHLTRRELTEQRVSVLQNEIAQVEKRVLQYGAGTLLSLLTVGLGFARLMM